MYHTFLPVRGARVQRQPHRLLAEVDLERALFGQLVPGQQARHLAQARGLGRRAALDGAALAPLVTTVASTAERRPARRRRRPATAGVSTCSSAVLVLRRGPELRRRRTLAAVALTPGWRQRRRGSYLVWGAKGLRRNNAVFETRAGMMHAAQSASLCRAAGTDLPRGSVGWSS